MVSHIDWVSSFYWILWPSYCVLSVCPRNTRFPRSTGNSRTKCKMPVPQKVRLHCEAQWPAAFPFEACALHRGPVQCPERLTGGHWGLHIPFPSSMRTSYPLPVPILNLKKSNLDSLKQIHSCSESTVHSKHISVQSVAFGISESHRWLPISSAIKFPLQTHLLLVSWGVQLKDILSIHLQT